LSITPPRAPSRVADPATGYAKAVASGRISAGGLTIAACRRHLQDLEHGPKRGLSWHPEIAHRAYGFFGLLRFAEGLHAGERFVLQPFQSFIVGSIVGWLTRDGSRRFRNAYVEIGKGNGKTPLAAALALYMLMADGETSAEVYFAARTRDQANVGFRDARRFAESPALAAHLEVSEHNIAHMKSGSYCRPVSSEARALDGKRVHCAVIDELHEHQDDQVVEKMRAGTKGRRQALIFEITNSGYDRASICWTHHRYTEQLLVAGKKNDSWFGFIACVDPKDDPLASERSWRKANPNLDVSITRKYLREQVREAQGIPTKRGMVTRLNFCVWTEHARQWIDMDEWDACEPPGLEQPREWYGGLDLATVSDLCAFVLVGRAGRLIHVKAFFWMPGDNIDRRVRRDGVPYDVWAREGRLRITHGNITDYDAIRDDLSRLSEQYLIREIAFDRWNASQLVSQLTADGFAMVQFGQGYYSMNAPMKDLELLIRSHGLAHGGCPVLRWMASNAVVKPDPAGNVKPDRAASTEKIDGIVALAMARARQIAAEASSDADDDLDGFLNDPIVF
jgi:phage terminase large subunit-like protein